MGNGRPDTSSVKASRFYIPRALVSTALTNAICIAANATIIRSSRKSACMVNSIAFDTISIGIAIKAPKGHDRPKKTPIPNMAVGCWIVLVNNRSLSANTRISFPSSIHRTSLGIQYSMSLANTPISIRKISNNAAHSTPTA